MFKPIREREIYIEPPQQLLTMPAKMAYIMNFDTGDKVDSIVVNGDSIVMSGTVATAIPARLIVGNRPVVTFILESGDINIDSLGTASGTPLNKEFEEFMACKRLTCLSFSKS